MHITADPSRNPVHLAKRVTPDAEGGLAAQSDGNLAPAARPL